MSTPGSGPRDDDADDTTPYWARGSYAPSWRAGRPAADDDARGWDETTGRGGARELDETRELGRAAASNRGDETDGPAPDATQGTAGTSASDNARRMAGGALAAGRLAGQGVRGAARLSAGATKASLRAARRASNAQGAGESGLGRLMEVHALSNAGDAAVTVGLAGTLFISAQPGEAKSHVVLFLVLTMLPFAIVAPLVGPLLDRYRHGRRWAMGATFALRGFLCWVLADAIERDSVWQFPAALAILVASKAYIVTRSSATPRLLPDGMSLVRANSRMSLAGVTGATIGGPLAGGAAALFGATWAFRAAFLLFVVGTILAILLPANIDSDRHDGSLRAPKLTMPPAVVAALRTNTGLRWVSGFLTMFMAFLMKTHPLPGWEDKVTTLLAIVVGAAAVGNALGSVAGAVVRALAPRVVILACLLADTAAVVVAAVHFDLMTAVIVGLVAGLGQALGKLALDTLIQDHLAEAVRTSAFARSETVLQLAWVLGGIFACIIPTDATIGMYAAAVVLLTWTALVVAWNAGRGPRLTSWGRGPRT
ncbi:MFS transporter [Dermacoccus nishinomiyaensis]|uniref:MFS transporter n=1 Tax=Dermacoccus nishinomiyaensis TaxID=1274 RepID=UPI0013F4744F|nr:MFS transporter [Dermacoccus nishinomiyaensis]MCG7429765.1 MFS transporter [Dermacoccus nishinomiyaensis]NHC32567.1 MFS transporter [Dermacoccus nishinomiyaensis]